MKSLNYSSAECHLTQELQENFPWNINPDLKIYFTKVAIFCSQRVPLCCVTFVIKEINRVHSHLEWKYFFINNWGYCTLRKLGAKYFSAASSCSSDSQLEHGLNYEYTRTLAWHFSTLPLTSLIAMGPSRFLIVSMHLKSVLNSFREHKAMLRFLFRYLHCAGWRILKVLHKYMCKYNTKQIWGEDMTLESL